MFIEGSPACRCAMAGKPRRKLASALPVPSLVAVRVVNPGVWEKKPRFWKKPSMSHLK